MSSQNTTKNPEINENNISGDAKIIINGKIFSANNPRLRRPHHVIPHKPVNPIQSNIGVTHNNSSGLIQTGNHRPKVDVNSEKLTQKDNDKVSDETVDN